MSSVSHPDPDRLVLAALPVDRYDVGGEQRQIMLSARELDVERFGDNRTWTNERLVYTHGYGITAVPVDAVTDQGTPDYLVSGINREPQLPIGEPRIYFGEVTDNDIITGTTTAEFDYPLDSDGESEAGAETVWSGTTGVGIGNPLADFVDELLPQEPGSPGGDPSTGRRRDAGEIYIVYGNNTGG